MYIFFLWYILPVSTVRSSLHPRKTAQYVAAGSTVGMHLFVRPVRTSSQLGSGALVLILPETSFTVRIALA